TIATEVATGAIISTGAVIAAGAVITTGTITTVAAFSVHRRFALHVAFGLRQQHTAAQLQRATAWVLTGHLELDHTAFLPHLFHALDAAPFQFAHVQQAIHAGHRFHERAVRHDRFHFAF